jgi:hypothetical protein
MSKVIIVLHCLIISAGMTICLSYGMANTQFISDLDATVKSYLKHMKKLFHGDIKQIRDPGDKKIISSYCSLPISSTKNITLMFTDEMINATSTSNQWIKLISLRETTNLSTDLYTTLPQPRYWTVARENLLASKYKISATILQNPSVFSGIMSNINSRLDFLSHYFDLPKLMRDRVVAVFRGAWIDRLGRIVNPLTCESMRLGACYSLKEFQSGSLNSSNHSRVLVSLASAWSGTWHFPMECLVALANFDYPKLSFDVTFHVPSKSPFIMSWMRLIGITDDKVLEGVQYADVLITPQPARCGSPYLAQIDWLRRKFKKYNTSDSPKPLLIYITRRKRGIKNDLVILPIVKDFVSRNDMMLYIHDDKKNMPSLQDQIDLFSKASFLVGPHGAAHMFLTFMDAYSSVIEFIPAEYPVFCYALLAHFGHHNYYMKVSLGGYVNVSVFKKLLNDMWDNQKADRNSALLPLPEEIPIVPPPRFLKFTG